MAGKLKWAVPFVLIVAGTATYFATRKPISPTTQPAVTTKPATQPTTKRHRPPPPVYPTYYEIVHKTNPAVATTQPLDSPVQLTDAAHVVIRDPVYLDPLGHLWITRPDGAPPKTALANPKELNEHVVIDHPIFVHWWLDADGEWQAAMIVKRAGGYDLITKTDRKPLCADRPFDWAAAYSTLDRFVVPTDVGVSVFIGGATVTERYHPIPGASATTSHPVTILDTAGILAWCPWDNGKTGSNGVSRFDGAQWLDLPANEWPARPIQCAMMTDGSVLRMASQPAVAPTTRPETEEGDSTESDVVADGLPDHVILTIGRLDPVSVDLSKVDELVGKLNDPDGDVRRAAYDELSRFGPSSWLRLEQLSVNQPPEAQLRIQQLLRNKIKPAFAGLTITDGRLDVIHRGADGTVLFYAPSGVKTIGDGKEPDEINPAWLTLRPDGRIDRPLMPQLVADQVPTQTTLQPLKHEWLTHDDGIYRRWDGSDFVPILTDAEKSYDRLIGLGTRGELVFQQSTPDGATLVVDPMVADPTPKLPAFTAAVPGGTAGWDTRGYPAIIRADNPTPWALEEFGWTTLKTGTDLHARPMTNPTTQPTTRSADGITYTGGRTTLTATAADGHTVEWTLPPDATGTIEPTLLCTADGLLFIHNQPGRLIRIRPTPDDPEPFRVEAIFSKDVPNTEKPARVWLDPVGRIVFVDEQTVTVFFPTGRIPHDIQTLMLKPGR